MAILYAPYIGDKPSAIQINGHRFLILAQEEESLQGNLMILGADDVRPVSCGDSRSEQTRAITELAKEIECDVVVAPSHVDVQDVIRDLSAQLPWVH